MSVLIKSLSIFILLILTFFFFDIDFALAHHPHDVIDEVEISPTYNNDQTVFSIVQGNLFKSTDGGQTWRRMVKGLDNRHWLYSLDIALQRKKTLYLSSLGDGIYKSQDGGDSWIKVNNGLGTLDIDLISVISDDVVLAAGTEKGLYKTKNGGESWSQVMVGQNKITAIASAPDKKEYVVLGDNQGTLYVSQDGGEVWRQYFSLIDSGPIRAIAISPNFSADKTFFVGTAHGGIYKTFDGGISFSEINSGIANKTIMSLAISPNYGTDSTVFASSWSEGVFYSDDGGNTWKRRSKGLSKIRQADNFRSPHFSELSISNTFSKDKTIYLAGFDGLFKSTDGGRVWREMKEIFSSRTLVGLALSPDYMNDSTVAFTTYLGGAYISNDQGGMWTAIHEGLESPRFYLNQPDGIVRFHDIVFSPNYRLDRTIFSASGNFTTFLISESGGKHWDKAKLNRETYGEASLIALSPNFATDRTIYLGNVESGAIFRSTDGGKNFPLVGRVGLRPDAWYYLSSLAISPNFASDRTLYAGVRGGIYKSVDAGYTWQLTSYGIAVVDRKAFATPLFVRGEEAPTSAKDPIVIAISPDYKVDGTVFASTALGLFITTDRGKSWAKLAGSEYGGDVPIEATAISPNYQNDGTFIVSVKGRGLFKTVDGGRTFTQIGEDLINNNYLLSNMNFYNPTSVPIKFSPSYSIDQTIYGFSGTKLFRSTDGGDNWESIETPRSANKNLMTYIYFFLTGSLKRRLFSCLIAALIATLFSYLLLGAFGKKRKLPYSKLQISTGVALATFILVLAVLST